MSLCRNCNCITSALIGERTFRHRPEPFRCRKTAEINTSLDVVAWCSESCKFLFFLTTSKMCASVCTDVSPTTAASSGLFSQARLRLRLLTADLCCKVTQGPGRVQNDWRFVSYGRWRSDCCYWLSTLCAFAFKQRPCFSFKKMLQSVLLSQVRIF